MNAIDIVWEGVRRALVPGGRLVIVVGDVCLSRRKFGRHVVVPLHASIQERCRAMGYDNLAPIIWHKIANASLEVANGSSFLGKPYEPNAIIKNDIEFILFQRKPGGYRSPTLAARIMSVIPEELHRQYFQQIWTLGGASTGKHPAPFPLKLAERLIRMFSFVGDTVLEDIPHLVGQINCHLSGQKLHPLIPGNHEEWNVRRRQALLTMVVHHFFWVKRQTEPPFWDDISPEGWQEIAKEYAIVFDNGPR